MHMYGVAQVAFGSGLNSEPVVDANVIRLAGLEYSSVSF